MIEVARAKMTKELAAEMNKRKGVIDKKYKEKQMVCFKKANGDVENFVECASKAMDDKEEKSEILNHKIYHAMFSFDSCVGDDIESQVTIKACQDAAKKIAIKYFNEYIENF